jgi:hypothetical protein
MAGVCSVSPWSLRWPSCEHGYDLVRMHGEFGWTALMVPLMVDGLTYVSSM